MSAYRVLIKSAAEKEMDALSERLHKRISAKILRLAENPRPRGNRKLEGKDGYRFRVGAYRVLYTIEDGSRIVTVYAVGHRREVYR